MDIIRSWEWQDRAIHQDHSQQPNTAKLSGSEKQRYCSHLSRADLYDPVSSGADDPVDGLLVHSLACPSTG